jgi:regulator of protease activity HflC (stomatin/prohibitin superfamily)
MDILSQRRGKRAAILGLVFQVVVSAAMLVIWLRTDSRSAMAAFWLLLGGVALWPMSAVLFYCRQLQRQESTELDDISASGSTTATIFDAEAKTLRPAANRLAWIGRWIVPIFTLLFAAYGMTMGIMVLRYVIHNPQSLLGHAAPDARTESLVFSVIGAFLGFMLSRYCTGMGSRETYRPLRAPGSYLLVNVLAAIAVTAGIGAAYSANTTVDLVAAYILPMLQIVLAAELALNLVLDLYRPRVPGQEQRLAFDSRLFNLIAEPGRVGHSIADTLNYQFGFEVSKTWFYQVLSRAMLPLLAVGVVILLGMTSIVIIPQGERGVISHWGKIDRQVEAGQYLTWPWPIDRIQRFNVQELHEVYLGAGKERTPNIINGREIIFWSEDHGQREEKDFLVAVQPQSNAKLDKTVPVGVNVIKLVVLVQYRIRDVVKYGFKYDDPPKQLEMMANQEMIRCLASATLTDRIDLSDRPQAIMSFGRQAAAEELKRRIQKAVEDKLGVEIVHVGIQAIHPSQEGVGDAPQGGKAESVASAYEKAMAAQQGIEEQRHNAQGQANVILTRVAGNPGLALKMALAIRKQRELESLSMAGERELDERVESMLVWVKNELKTLQDEINVDQLMGRVSANLAAATRPAGTEKVSMESLGNEIRERLEMRDLYLQYISELEGIKARKTGELSAVLARTNEDVENLFKSASGQPAVLETEAQAQRWSTEMVGRANSENFQRELAAFKNAPNVYMLDRYLDVYDQAMPGLTKYILGVPRDKIDLRVDLRTEAQPLEGTGEKIPTGGNNQGN